jgi:hypothetical protein
LPQSIECWHKETWTVSQVSSTHAFSGLRVFTVLAMLPQKTRMLLSTPGGTYCVHSHKRNKSKYKSQKGLSIYYFPGGPQAFSAAWYEARRGQVIPPRLDIQPVSNRGTRSPFRPSRSPLPNFCYWTRQLTGETNSLYANGAYATKICNEHVGDLREIEAIEALGTKLTERKETPIVQYSLRQTA